MRRWKLVFGSLFALALATMFLGGCVVRTRPVHHQAHGVVYVGTDGGRHHPGRGHGHGHQDR